MSTHPYTSLRKELHISQTTLARVAGVSAQVVMRTEQGLYETPSVKILTALKSVCDDAGIACNVDDLMVRHRNYVRSLRGRNSGEIHAGVDLYLNGVHLKPMWAYFAPSVAAFCKLLVVQLSPVQRWGFTGNMPPLVENAFRDVGVENGSIRRINACLSGN